MNHPFFPDGALLLGKGTLNNVFLILYGTYREHIINNGRKAGSCNIGLNQLAKFATVEKRTAIKSFDTLVDLNLVVGHTTDDGDFKYSINVDLFESALEFLETQIKSPKHEADFLKAFQDGDMDVMADLGFEMHYGLKSQFAERPAAKTTFVRESEDMWKNSHGSGKGGGILHHLDPKVVENSTSFDSENSQTVQNSTGFQKVVENSTTPTESGGKFHQFSSKVVENSTTFDEISLSGMEKVVEFYTTFVGDAIEKWGKNHLLSVLDDFGHDKNSDVAQIILNFEALTPEEIEAKVVEFCTIVVEFSTRGGVILHDLPLQQSENEEVASPNKYKEKKKCRETPILNEKNDIEEGVKERDGKTLRRVKQVYPFFSAEDVDKFVNNIDEACTSPLKLFLYNLWGYASEMTDCRVEGAYDDEDEELSEEEFFNPEGYPISFQDFQRLKKDAYEQTEIDIQNGYPEVDENIQLSFTEMFDVSLLSQIFDWKTEALDCRSRSVIISKDGIRNIEAETLSDTLKKPQGRIERSEAAQASKQMMREIWKRRDNPSQLTSIEQVILWMLQEFYNYIPEDDHFRLKGEGILYRDSYRMLKAQFTKKGFSVKDFFRCISNYDEPKGDQFSISNNPFFVPGVKFLNKLKQETSCLECLSE